MKVSANKILPLFFTNALFNVSGEFRRIGAEIEAKM